LPVEEQRKLKGESLDVKVRKLVSPGVKERSKKGPGVFIPVSSWSLLEAWESWQRKPYSLLA
jgi:hypothetical protein